MHVAKLNDCLLPELFLQEDSWRGPKVGQIKDVFILVLEAKHDLDGAVAEDHAAAAMERMRARVCVECGGAVSKRHDILVVEELLEQLVKRHLKHLSRHFCLIDNELFALVAEAEHIDRVIVLLGQGRLLSLLVRGLFPVLDLDAAIVMIVVISMKKPDLLALFVITEMQCLSGQFLDHLIE